MTSPKKNDLNLSVVRGEALGVSKKDVVI